jgi:extradiol dioxygenase family protein
VEPEPPVDLRAPLGDEVEGRLQVVAESPAAGAVADQENVFGAVFGHAGEYTARMTRRRVFHLAIPCRDLDETVRFYVDGLGCRLARRREDRVNFDFFGDQVVCHLAPDGIDPEPEMYPRHFGMTFLEEEDFRDVLDRARRLQLPFFREPFVRFPGEPAEHETFFLRDPSNNLLEFKLYRDPAYVY